MAAVQNKTPLADLVTPISKPLKRNGKRIRALDILGKDLEFLQAVSDPAFDVSGITNKDLQKKLADTPWAKSMTGKQLSGRISRHLALLREHGLIKKLPNQRKYALTDKGRKITSALNIALATSVDVLINAA